jgi:hypothetical protein
LDGYDCLGWARHVERDGEGAPTKHVEGMGGGFDLLGGPGSFWRDKAAADTCERQGKFHQHGKRCDGARHHEVERLSEIGVVAESFGASCEDGHVAKLELGDERFEERRLFGRGFDERELDARPDDLEHDARKAGAGAEIKYIR